MVRVRVHQDDDRYVPGLQTLRGQRSFEIAPSTAVRTDTGVDEDDVASDQQEQAVVRQHDLAPVVHKRRERCASLVGRGVRCQDSAVFGSSPSRMRRTSVAVTLESCTIARF